MMQIVRDRPPNFAQIVEVFPSARRESVIFTYGDKIYSLSSSEISPALMEHELVHSIRQGKTVAEIEDWWRKYLEHDQFRYEEELLAHQAEYRHFITNDANRQTKRRQLATIAKRLSSPLYGSMLTVSQAKRAILDA